MIKITHEFATIEEAITHLATVKGTKTVATDPAAKPAADKPKATATDKAAEKLKDMAAEKLKADDKKPEPVADKPKADAPSYDVVGAAITAAAKTHRTELVALLGEFSAKSGKELKPEQYAAFMDKLGGITAPADGDLS